MQRTRWPDVLYVRRPCRAHRMTAFANRNTKYISNPPCNTHHTGPIAAATIFLNQRCKNRIAGMSPKPTPSLLVLQTAFLAPSAVSTPSREPLHRASSTRTTLPCYFRVSVRNNSSEKPLWWCGASAAAQAPPAMRRSRRPLGLCPSNAWDTTRRAGGTAEEGTEHPDRARSSAAEAILRLAKFSVS